MGTRMKKLLLCSSVLFLMSGVCFAGGDENEYITTKNDAVFGLSKNAPVPNYNVPGVSNVDRMDYYNFKLCKELSVPNVKVDRELNLQPTVVSKSTRIRHYLDALEGSPDRMQ